MNVATGQEIVLQSAKILRRIEYSWYRRGASRSLKRLGEKMGDSPYERIYHVHIRKTAGTSLNSAFLGGDASEQARRMQALRKDRLHAKVFDGRPAVGWNTKLINAGHFFFGFSHVPYYELTLPTRTFTFTVFRDPLERLLSYYRMLNDYLSLGYYRFTGARNPSVERESSFAEMGFRNFLEKAPRKHIHSHLFMFSKDFDLSEAMERANEISAIYEVGSIHSIRDDVMKVFNFDLNIGRLNSGHYREQLQDRDIDLAREALAPEFAFYEKAKALQNYRT